MAEGAERRGEELQHGEGHQLSRALASAGLPSPVDLRHGGGEDVRNAEQALHTLLSFYHRSLDAKEELEEQRRRLHADAKRAEQREHRLQESASQKDKEINRLSHLCEQTKCAQLSPPSLATRCTAAPVKRKRMLPLRFLAGRNLLRT